MKTLRISLITLALALLAGCYTEERALVAFSNLKEGMTEQQLTAALGSPKSVETNADIVVWTYSEGSVFLRGGVVYSWNVADRKPR